MKRKALGKGLSALIPEPEPESITSGSPLDLPVDRLAPNPYQPRRSINPVALDELVASIRESGVVQPILVRPLGDRYQIVAGERRWRAAQKLGLATIPGVVREVTDDRLLELALIENIQRQELSPLEEAAAFRRLQDELRLTQEDIARRVGRDRSTVANTVRLLRLPRQVQDLIAESRLDAGHGRALLALDRTEDQVSLAAEAALRGLSVREVERRVASLRSPAATPKTRAKDPNTRAAEERLRAALGTRIEISRRGRGGVLRVAFSSEAELQRLFDLLTRAARARPA
jgi:ParB family chromosome partitioning protein